MNSVVSINLEEFVTSKVPMRGKRLAVGSLRVFVILSKLSTWVGGTGLKLDLMVARIGSLR